MICRQQQLIADTIYHLELKKRLGNYAWMGTEIAVPCYFSLCQCIDMPVHQWQGRILRTVLTLALIAMTRVCWSTFSYSSHRISLCVC